MLLLANKLLNSISMRRIAYASPLNPIASGISDYSEELLPYLGRYVDLTLYHDDGLRPSNPMLGQYCELRPISRLERDQRRKRFDAIIYHMGNSAAHHAIWGTMQRVPGIVVLHEFVLHHFMLQYYATTLGDIERYQAEAARRYGPEGEHIAKLMMHGRFVEAAFELPFCEDVLDRAQGLIAHSRYVLARAAAIRPTLAMGLAPMGVPLPPLINKAAARARRGLAGDAPILASFGHINPYKRLEAALRAVRQLREPYPSLQYLLVGSVSPHFQLQSLIERLGMQEYVHATGFVDRATFEEYVAATDICLNLRHPTAGETSASLLRLLGAARPSLVTASGAFSELPAGVAAQVDPDASEGDLIHAYCRVLLDQPEMAQALGTAARCFVEQEHSLDASAAAYMRFLAQRYGWEAPVAMRPRLWDPTPELAMPEAKPPQQLKHSQENAQADLPRSALTSNIAIAAAALGIAEHDPMLTQVAQAIADIEG